MNRQQLDSNVDEAQSYSMNNASGVFYMLTKIFRSSESPLMSALQSQYVSNEQDCDDTNLLVHPNMLELCDH